MTLRLVAQVVDDKSNNTHFLVVKNIDELCAIGRGIVSAWKSVSNSLTDENTFAPQMRDISVFLNSAMFEIHESLELNSEQRTQLGIYRFCHINKIPQYKDGEAWTVQMVSMYISDETMWFKVSFSRGNEHHILCTRPSATSF